jgi:hypothetical protein
MTPKEKAKELFDRYNKTVNTITNEPIKRCALIAVDELIDFAKLTDATNGWDHLNYWTQVKQEIEKL